MEWIVAGIGLLLVVIALGVWRWGGARLAATGLPAGEVVYSDTGGWEAVEQPLLSRRFGLVGKPDYLVRVDARMLVPVEVKSRHKPATVPSGHILQLATYCLLVEDVHKVRPTHGLLHYADATLRIDYTPALRQAVLDAADGIRRARTAPDLSRDHNDPARCRACGYAHQCGEEI
jgi:CRISPR-associated exonuclease Cas4